MADSPWSPEPDELLEPEAFLARARPRPSDEFVQITERQLLGRQRVALRSSAGFAAVALASVLGGLLYLVGGFGGGPLSLTDDDVRARDACQSRTIESSPAAAALELRDGRVVVIRRPEPPTGRVPPCP